MESKKNKKVNLERKRTAFFNIGLLGAGAFTLAAFTYQDEITDPNEEHYSSSAHIEYVLEDVEPEVKEPEVKLEMEEPTTEDPSSQSMDAGSVSENSQASSNSSNTPEGGITGIGAPKPPKGPIVDITPDDQVEDFPPIPAEYIGGDPQMHKDITTRVEYPEISRELGDEGRVFVEFIIEKDGSVSHVKVKRGKTRELDREAIRVVRTLNSWKPAESAYGPVRSMAVVPINFVLAKE